MTHVAFEPDLGRLRALLASMDEWLGNDEGLMTEDVVEWRDQLATALGLPVQDAAAPSSGEADQP